MANNYTESSSLIRIPAEKIAKAQEIVDRVREELTTEDDSFGCDVEILAGEGVWISHDESINIENAEVLVRALVEELELDGVFVCSYAHTCSKPRIDAFGGGAFAVQNGRDTIWVDAVEMALSLAKHT